MMVKKGTLLFLLLLTYSTLFCQIENFTEKFELPEEVKETSGLLFLNGKIITHNDSGDDANLYEVDSLSGLLLRTISISNATNVDWEDISQDDTHIYIADIGNNNGNRTDLSIYKILKTDYLNSTSVVADIITFSYEDQTDFSEQVNSSNFDAEAISIYQNQIFLFTKNWANFMTNVYTVPITAGNYNAVKVSSYDTQGLITGSSYNSFDDSFMLTGYDDTLTPFLVYVDHNRPPGTNIFGGTPQKISLTQELGQGNQVEGITHYHEGNYYISRERFVTTVNGNEVTVVQKLFEFYNVGSSLLSLDENSFHSKINVYPNPTKNIITIDNLTNSKQISRIEIYTPGGIKIKHALSNHSIDLRNVSSGIYFLKIIFTNAFSAVKKIVKI